MNVALLLSQTNCASKRVICRIEPNDLWSLSQVFAKKELGLLDKHRLELLE